MRTSNPQYQNSKTWNSGILQTPPGTPSLFRPGSKGSPKATQGGRAEQGPEPGSKLPAPCLPFSRSAVRVYFKNHQHLRADIGIFIFMYGL